MSVYVDDADQPYGRMIMCHMIADRREELLAMADRIGVDRRHLQCTGTYREHMDICKSKRRLAIEHGALAITNRALVRRLLRRRADSDG